MGSFIAVVTSPIEEKKKYCRTERRNFVSTRHILEESHKFDDEHNNTISNIGNADSLVNYGSWVQCLKYLYYRTLIQVREKEESGLHL
jgi:hypothetical protein